MDSKETIPTSNHGEEHIFKTHSPLLIDLNDTELLAHQVAGHNQTGVEVLKHKAGFLLKPYQPDSRGWRELEFYRKVYKGSENPCSPEVRRHLQKLTPTFFGVGKIAFNGGIQEYLMLEDVVDGLKKPCVMDMKIGAITSNPTALPAKIESEKRKYLGTKPSLGISMAGMQYFDISKDEFVRKERDFGKGLDHATLLNALKEFLNYKPDNSSRVVVQQILLKLHAVLEFFEVQNEFAFYSSSILLAYDASALSTLPENNVTNGFDDLDDCSLVRVFMIDFAHAFPPNPETSRDENYLFGLTNAIRLFEGLMN